MPDKRSPYGVKKHCRLQRVLTAVYVNVEASARFSLLIINSLDAKVQSADKTKKFLADASHDKLYLLWSGACLILFASNQGFSIFRTLACGGPLVI